MHATQNGYYFLLLLVTGISYSNSILFPFLGASLYQTYLEEGIRFRENIFLGNEPIFHEYDFIVVGAGPGGCVVANRLSENPNWKVLILESGEDENIYTDIPATVAHWTQTSYNWGYKAEKTGNACLATEGQRCPMPRGKGLGGSSILNNMIYTRGHRKDYDDYAAAGNQGWSYDEVLPYFLKSENNTVPEYYNSSYHAHDGYLNVERIRYQTGVLEGFLESGEELGYKKIDYTEPTQHGYSRLQVTQKRGRRVSASKAYLKSIMHRTNLHVTILTRVTKVLINPETKNAYGVEFVKNYRRRVVFARKEVILSAGAINSPQLLMLSGVGPQEHLMQLGIPVIQNLNVGENLYEHYCYHGLMFFVNETDSSLKLNRLNLQVFLDWLNNGKGLLTLPGGAEGLAYVHSKYNNPTPLDDRTDIEFIFMGGSFSSDSGVYFRKSYGITQCMYDQMFSGGNNRDTWTILPMLLHPRSIGRVTLRDKNPWSAPRIHFPYFEDAHDMKVMVDAIQQVIKWSETSAFQKFGTRLNPATLPQCSQHTFKSDEYWACMATYFTGTLHHQSGTCKMGPSTDPTAVVDPELRVYGITNLRVVDASIFPKIPGAHLYAPTLMVGEKAADMIKRTWHSKSDVRQEVTDSPYELYYQTSVAPCLNETNDIQ